ncbi:MAG TPA: hypothetical protein VKV38_15465 [Trebonia sp.]|nr:hypothetical protein [Trebonia sp.]
MTEAPVFTVVADVAIVKGKTAAADRAWLSCPDGTARRAVMHVVHDLPHLVVESVFGLEDGLWGTIAAGGPAPAARALRRRNGRIRLVADAPAGGMAARDWPGHLVARAAVNAVLNRWRDGPDTPSGVRERLRAHGGDAGELAGRLDDDSIRAAAAGVRRLYREWAALPGGGALRVTWPLHDSWLRPSRRPFAMAQRT